MDIVELNQDEIVVVSGGGCIGSTVGFAIGTVGTFIASIVVAGIALNKGNQGVYSAGGITVNKNDGDIVAQVVAVFSSMGNMIFECLKERGMLRGASVRAFFLIAGGLFMFNVVRGFFEG